MPNFIKKLLGLAPSVVRAAQFAGHFYPEDKESLIAKLDAHLDAHHADGPRPRALIVPFAEVEYLEPYAAGWARARRAHAEQAYARVVLLTSALRIPFQGVALTAVEAWRTPLGDTWLDHAALERVIALADVRQIEEAHIPEPALEIAQLYVQRALPKTPIVPLLMGDGAYGRLLPALDALWDEHTLVVLATELSRERAQPEADAIDAETIRAALAYDVDAIKRGHASARAPLKALLSLAKQRGLAVEELARGTSAPMDADHERYVVGFGALALG
ncbi:MAG: AmmeMemoRadiSam system protein B [Myxococcota bacterium]